MKKILVVFVLLISLGVISYAEKEVAGFSVLLEVDENNNLSGCRVAAKIRDSVNGDLDKNLEFSWKYGASSDTLAMFGLQTLNEIKRLEEIE